MAPNNLCKVRYRVHPPSRQVTPEVCPESVDEVPLARVTWGRPLAPTASSLPARALWRPLPPILSIINLNPIVPFKKTFPQAKLGRHVSPSKQFGQLDIVKIDNIFKIKGTAVEAARRLVQDERYGRVQDCTTALGYTCTSGSQGQWQLRRQLACTMPSFHNNTLRLSHV
ncbi:unnamed protein product [Nezara viridula]|uniref:Uncharacterized protein n=1 Tax=Nezara viridula TaxID=85310 RepID=A0A9P0H5G5_NEZVI|nr:unnamed protein product [Nezara viridula]